MLKGEEQSQGQTEGGVAVTAEAEAANTVEKYFHSTENAIP